jgi:hypothetical protein
MRLSVIPNDSGYADKAMRERIVSITLNGVHLLPKSVIFADEETGEVLTVVRSDDGRVVRSKENHLKVLTELKHGRVRIELRPAPKIINGKARVISVDELKERLS